MKKLLFSLLLIGSFTVINAQTVEEIVAKHNEAVGGVDAWKKVNSIRMEGNMQVNGAAVTMTQTILNNKASRQDITVNGMSGYNILTNTEGWNFMPFQGQTQPEALTSDDVKEAQSGLDVQGELIDYKEKGSTVALMGKEDVEGTECFKLVVTFKSGKTKTLYLDPQSYLTIREKETVKANGQEMESATNLSNYQKLPEGILVPMSIGLPFGEMTISKVEVNQPVDEAIFKPSK